MADGEKCISCGKMVQKPVIAWGEVDKEKVSDFS